MPPFDALPNWLRALLIGGALAALLAVFVARKSDLKKPILGGPIAKVLHYLAAVAIVAPGIVLLTGTLLFKLTFGEAVGLCLGSLGVGFVLLVLLAFFEIGKRTELPPTTDSSV
jgi:type IV secretory pathway VirB2 component (pilin)